MLNKRQAHFGKIPESSVVEDFQIEIAKARGVGDYLDLNDLPAGDLKAERPGQSPAARDVSKQN